MSLGRASAKQDGNVIPSSSLFLLDNCHMYTSTGRYIFSLFFILGLVVMCENSSSSEVSANGMGMFVLLTLLVKFVIVLECLFYKMYLFSKGDLSGICHEATSAKAALKKKTKVILRIVLVF